VIVEVMVAVVVEAVVVVVVVVLLLSSAVVARDLSVSRAISCQVRARLVVVGEGSWVMMASKYLLSAGGCGGLI